MAVTANQLITAQDAGNIRSLRAGAFNHYQGTLVFEASGYSTNVISTTANPFMGIAIAQYDNSAGSAGDMSVEFFTTGSFQLVGSSFTQADAGKLIYATDNYVISVTSTNQPPVGRCIEFVSSTLIMVEIHPLGGI